MDVLTGSNSSHLHRICDGCEFKFFCHPDTAAVSGNEPRPSSICPHEATVVKNGMIFTQSSRFTTCFVVKAGTVKAFHVNEEGDEKVMAFYLPGQMFGFDGVASGLHTCSAIALERSQLCRINTQQYEDAERGNFQVACGLLRAISRELNSAERMNRWLSQNTAEERVVGFLLDISNRYRLAHLRYTQFRMAMARTDIANYLGLALETVSHILKRLQRECLIEVHGREIQLSQMSQLRARVCTDDYGDAGTSSSVGVHRQVIHPYALQTHSSDWK